MTNDLVDFVVARLGDLVGFALFDRLDQQLEGSQGLQERMWARREIENYLCQPETLLAYAQASGREEGPGPLFGAAEGDRRKNAMNESIEDFVPPAALRDQRDAWWVDIKASDDFLDRVFASFFKKLSLPNLMPKTDYHVLARCVPLDLFDSEVRTVLDVIVTTARAARPVSE